MKRVMRVGLVAIAAVITSAVAGVVVLSGGDVAFAWRVISHGESSTNDLHWKGHVTVAAGDPRSWPGTDRCNDVQRAAGGDLDSVLLAGGATQLVVIRDGQLVCQWAAPGHSIDELRPAFSISKTITALLLSRAVAAGQMSWDDPITKWIPELGDRDSRFARITLADLVDMRSGIEFQVVTRFPWFNQGAPRVYYASDLQSATIQDPRISSAPGVFTYNDWAPNLLGIAYQRATGNLMAGPGATALWADIGAQKPAWWLVDGHGFPWHESGFVATAPDFARVGELLLDDPNSDFAHRSAVALHTPVVSDESGAPPGYGSVPMGYGNGLWILHDTAHPAYAALGYHGQVMVVDPSTDTVVVRLGDSGYENVTSEPQIAAELERWAREM
ncbi:serine hydrolase domain-containing protein [Arthrobacter sp. YAF34]|uniref:serine hydrolase domain-containing protein n=1 Tax=Arthrobacter sp. YAF34 TaxID=3233083 RepID=UPI003F93C352